MMGEKKLREIKAELDAARQGRRIAKPSKEAKKDLETLKMTLAALEEAASKLKRKRRPAKRVKR